ncbi:MAG: O-antigen/teichoic acid export membrane protein [Myxococcota bacterium]|jgi:O-antigen/teichoic acid export membrane protein
MSRRLIVNAAMSVAQVVVIGAVYFFLYRFLLKAVGVEILGVWSVVLATTSVGRFSNLGLNASVVKFVAQYLARGDRAKAVAVLETSAVALGGLLLVVVIALYPIARLVLGYFIEADYLDDALALLPWALASLWLSVLAGVFQSGLDGLQRIDLRSGLMMVATLIYLGLCFALVPDHGIMGLAYAQIAQVSILLTFNSLLLRRMIPEMPLVPYRFRRDVFKELLGYGIQIQLMTIGSLLLEPVTKGLVARFGGVAMAGYFEMANRMVIQLRQLINGATQAIVPTIAHRQETDAMEGSEGSVKALYLSTYRTLFFVIFPTLAFTLAAIPVISEVWIGRYEPHFVHVAFVLACGLYLGMLSSPAFFTNLGTGDLKWNTIATFLMLVITATPALVTGGAIGGFGVAISYALAFVIGGATILRGFLRTQALPMSSAIPRESFGVLFAAFPAAILPLAVYQLWRDSLGLGATAGLSALIFIAMIIIPVWRHPMRGRLTAVVHRFTRPTTRS